MRMSVALEHTTVFASRLARALTELAVAAAIIVGAVVVGHDLREWRTWYHGRPDYFERPAPAPVVTEP